MTLCRGISEYNRTSVSNRKMKYVVPRNFDSTWKANCCPSTSVGLVLTL